MKNVKNDLYVADKSSICGKDKHTVTSYFCGCGGLDLGFLGGFKHKDIDVSELPFEIVAAYDNDIKAIETYKTNISSHAEVRDLSIIDINAVPSTDVLIGGFPCQDFSVCGPRVGLQSERGNLYKTMIRYLEMYRPMALVAENVPGLSMMLKGKVLELIRKEIVAAGYRVDTWNLYAPDYCIPQKRRRLFIVAVRDDLEGFPSIPAPVPFPNHKITTRWAIEDLITISDESVANQSQYFKALKAKKKFSQGDETVMPDEPCYTIRANSHSRIQFHYALGRRLTVRECARVQTFPDNFIFPHSTTANMTQIGNAVPPLLGHAVASSISKYLEEQKCLVSQRSMV